MPLTAAAMQAHDQLIHDLDLGVYGTGTRLPGERELASRLGVSRVTLRAALTEIEAAGRLIRSAQRGWFVPSSVVGEPPSTLQSFSEMARARGLRPSAKVLRHETRGATLEEAEKLRIAPTAPVIQIDRLRAMDGRPVCFDVVVIAAERAPAIADADLNDASLYETLGELCGVSIHRSAYTVIAATTDGKLARLLDTVPGAAVLIGEEVAYTIDGTPILLGTNSYRGDAYRFHADLFRVAQSPPA